MDFAIGFLIAADIGMTGIGGGRFTVPALVLNGARTMLAKRTSKQKATRRAAMVVPSK